MLKRLIGLTAVIFFVSLLVASGVMAQNHTSAGSKDLVGCFKDSAHSRDMTGHTFSQSNMTTETCISVCSQKGFIYAATQFGSHCFCDNKYGSQGTATNCDMSCSGNSSQICGGHSANSVYRIKASSAAKPAQPANPPGSAAAAKTIYNNWNKVAVTNGPTSNTQFSTNTPVTITSILNYHWNNGKGHSIGTISLKGSNGKVYGPWQASGLPSAVPAANWIAKPNVTIPAGTYTVIDSHPATWSQNSGSNGSGFSNISGY